jgi:hypothetical protein
MTSVEKMKLVKFQLSFQSSNLGAKLSSLPHKSIQRLASVSSFLSLHFMFLNKNR